MKLHSLAQFYTPSWIAKYIVESAINTYIRSNPKIEEIKALKILDPSCGEGIFLHTALKYLIQQISNHPDNNWTSSKISHHILINQLYGIDIDPSQVEICCKNLNCEKFNFNLRKFNALIPPPNSVQPVQNAIHEKVRKEIKIKFIRQFYSEEADSDFNSLMKLESQIFRDVSRDHQFALSLPDKSIAIPWRVAFPECEGKFDIIIGNPPWGGDLVPSHLLEKYIVGSHQVDTWSLFIERSMEALKNNGILGFVIPNSLLMNENYIKTRELILKSSQIKEIINLGDAIFPGITQPCMIIILEKLEEVTKGNIKIIPHLGYELVNQVRDEKTNLSSINYNSCLQERFEDNLDYSFDIFSIGYDDFLKEVERDVESTQKHCKYLGDLVENGRGVEINRNGIIIICSQCGWWNPPFSQRNLNSKACVNPNCKGIIFQVDKSINIVSDEKVTSQSKPIISGYQVSRYYIRGHRFINTNGKGINFKSESLYQGKKILLRKTGFGFNAAIDYDNRFTTQVVYIFKLKRSANISLEYILGLLNSNVIHTYYYSKYADLNRREFPHFTQGKVLKLPIKIPESTLEKSIVLNIEHRVKTITDLYKLQNDLKEENLSILIKLKQLDKEIHDLVFDLYDINEKYRDFVFQNFHISEKHKG
ncbi:MAG: hypothetical protein EAX86_03725 [Candidatus Heimdallarchaeota archaeon]|nr:hypothetical protein [Candidatus Heimdallarchaeota archaeon]